MAGSKTEQKSAPATPPPATPPKSKSSTLKSKSQAPSKSPSKSQIPSKSQTPSKLQVPSNTQIPSKSQTTSKLQVLSKTQIPSKSQLPSKSPTTISTRPPQPPQSQPTTGPQDFGTGFVGIIQHVISNAPFYFEEFVKAMKTFFAQLVSSELVHVTNPDRYYY